jgi:hypothetical protein
MARTGIRQFRAALADHAHESTLMRAYRQIARTPRHVAAMVGGDWAAWPTATAEARSFADWPVWTDAPAATEAMAERQAFGDWSQWSGDPVQQQTAARSAPFGDWSTWQQQPA